MRILREAGLWFLVMVCGLLFIEPMLGRRALLLLGAAALIFGVLKEAFVVRPQAGSGAPVR